MIRLFVALRPPPTIRTLLLDTMQGVTGARWQDDEQLHITLRFIGEVDEPMAEDIDVALSSLYAPPVPLAVSGVGRFEQRGRSTAIWAGVTPRDPLAALHRKIDAALVRCGLEPERRAYFPHVTLARLNASSGPVDRWLLDHAALRSRPWIADSITLFRSDVGRGGARYEGIARYRLRG